MSTNRLRGLPSLQHLVRLIGSTPEATAKAIMAPKPCIKNYEARHYLTKLFQGMSPEKVMAAALADSREDVRDTALEIIPLGEQYLLEHDTGWFRKIDPIVHRVSRDLLIPIKPLGIMRVGSEVVVVWPQTWKTISLTPEQFNIFASYMKFGFLDKFPDFTDFHWLEMSVPKGQKIRELRVRTVDSAYLLSVNQLLELEKNWDAALKIVEAAQQEGWRPKKDNPDQGDFGF